MMYRRLGRSGLQVSALSLGSWVTFSHQNDLDGAMASMAAAEERGCNFFDNAEEYGLGAAETLMGRAFQELGWGREQFVVSTKLYYGIHDAPNLKNTLNRKYLMQAIEGSLERLQMDFVDLLFCHRPDPHTPLEETVWAMHDIVDRGMALYWGTSCWSAADIREAYEIADRHHLHKPLMDQPQYNLLERHAVEVDLAPVCEELGIGATIFSPLAAGILTGKYVDGIPTDSRVAANVYDWMEGRAKDEVVVAKTRQLVEIASRLDMTAAQLSLAWCLRNPHVSTVITGASRPEQVESNFAVVDMLDRVTDDVAAELDQIFPVSARG